MGYEIERLVSVIDDEFLCSICKLVLENPMQSPCEHVFCNECIKEWLTVQTSCPVDACALTFSQIRPTPRYFRNMLGKVEVKCNFESNGCQSIVSLEDLQRHLSKCDFNPNVKVICHKECNIKIAKLIEEVEEQRKEIAKLTDEVSRKEQETITLNDEITRSANVIQCQEEEIAKHCDTALLLLQETVKVFKKPKWHICLNMKTSINQPQILEHGREDLEAFAQFSSPFEPSGPSFKLKVLNPSNNDIVIGLTRRGYPTQTSPGYKDDYVGFSNHGHVFVNGTTKKSGQQWENYDIVECGIRFPKGFQNDGTSNVEVYFTINEQIMFTEIVKIPIDGFYLPVYMWSDRGNNSEVPKVEILNLF